MTPNEVYEWGSVGLSRSTPHERLTQTAQPRNLIKGENMATVAPWYQRGGDDTGDITYRTTALGGNKYLRKNESREQITSPYVISVF